jgi:dolichyl-diphosphooligosaccharide--protein glycosyltransferase
MSKALKAWWPMAGISLILFVPSYYDTDYINIFGYKGQGWRDYYERIAPYVKMTSLSSPAVIVTPPGDYDSLCNYLGAHRRVLSEDDLISADRMKQLVAAYPEENVYLLYIEDMIWNFSSIMDYVELHCFSHVTNVMNCSDGTIDLNRGVMNDGSFDIPLRAALFINDGKVVDRKNYRTDGGYYLQVLMKNNKTYMILVADERLFQTNFNQHYLLGNYDQQYFEEVYNDFPVARVLKVKRAAGDDSTR